MSFIVNSKMDYFTQTYSNKLVHSKGTPVEVESDAAGVIHEVPNMRHCQHSLSTKGKYQKIHYVRTPAEVESDVAGIIH